MPRRRILPAGDRAVLVELDSLAEVLGLQAALALHPQPGQVDVVAAARTLLVTADSAASLAKIARALHTLEPAPAPAAGAEVVLDVVYDGQDLAAVGTLTGLGPDGVVAVHTGQLWTAAFGGFAPGFAYLVGENDRLHVPRRNSPRTAVPAGSVALGGAYSAVYPASSPGGWQLIGRTGALLWDLGRDSPALLPPGSRVRFNAVRATAAVQPARPGGGAAAATAPHARPGLVVVRTGLQATIQDLGRPGFAAVGVTGSGAMDRRALRQANRLAGNPAGAAGLEVLYGGLAVTAAADLVVAASGAAVGLSVTGAGPDAEQPMLAPFALLAGQTLALGTPVEGLRTYLAVRGGLAVAPVLGSRSTDTLSGLGPAPLKAGMAVPVLGAPPSSVVGHPELPDPATGGPTVLHYVPGPRQDWFSAASQARFTSGVWTVTAESNRIGVRFGGRALDRAKDGELASEGTVRGAIQIPPEGLPVLFLADHPVTGGYPVIGVVVGADLDKAGQLRPGTLVRFQPC